MSGNNDKEYYQHAAKVPYVARISAWARTNVFNHFMKSMRVLPTDRILDVGVSLDNTSPEANILEQMYPYPEQLTCAGIAEGGNFSANYPKIAYHKIEEKPPLPFADKSFDIAYSNAVVEHVGCRQSQRLYINELTRVAKSVYIIVPNRLFPVEHHTALPFINYLPLSLMRRILRGTRWDHWASEQTLNPHYPWDLKSILPTNESFKIVPHGIRLGWVSSNLIAYTAREK